MPVRMPQMKCTGAPSQWSRSYLEGSDPSRLHVRGATPSPCAAGAYGCDERYSRASSKPATILCDRSLADQDPGPGWWVRIYPSDNVRIQYQGGDYIPDLVIREGDAFWIVEGKADSGKSDAMVAAKKDETTLRKMRRGARWSGQTWRYLLAYESDVKLVHSWANLKAKATVVDP